MYFTIAAGRGGVNFKTLHKSVAKLVKPDQLFIIQKEGETPWNDCDHD